MSSYLLLNIFVIIIPLLLSFEKKIKFYKKFRELSISIITVGSIFIIWDIFAVKRGDWGFNHKYVTGINLLNLPLEEILFFITIPYSSIFLYETMKFYLQNRIINNELNLKRIYPALVTAVLLILSAVYLNHYYTFTVLIFCAVFLLITFFLFNDILSSKLFWSFIFLTFIPFVIVNYFLTSLPIVIYNPDAILGIRILTIPVEDFFYSFSMLSLYLFIYIKSVRK
ncbi:MAG: lycopene cyclase domain-containing protein [Ignavibacteriaceae bacterium]